MRPEEGAGPGTVVLSDRGLLLLRDSRLNEGLVLPVIALPGLLLPFLLLLFVLGSHSFLLSFLLSSSIQSNLITYNLPPTLTHYDLLSFTLSLSTITTLDLFLSINESANTHILIPFFLYSGAL